MNSDKERGSPSGRYVQYGAGLSAPDGWESYDSSLTLRIERVPVLRALKRKRLFPAATLRGDIVRGLPIPDGTVAGAYASHVLEHLTRADFFKALRNTYVMLAPGGTFRLIVPDLAARARKYVSALDIGSKDASDVFMRECLTGVETLDAGLIARLRRLFGNSSHLWMWDELSLRAALAAEGFVDIRRCRFGDADDPMFARVEDETRFVDAGMTECAMEARKPAMRE